MDISDNFLPAGLLAHFTIISFIELSDIKEKKLFFEIHLEENNEILGNYKSALYESKGFTEVTLQDFPIRGKSVYLKIKRRRWRLKTDHNKIIRTDFIS